MYISLGCMEDGTALGDVELPPWAKSDPQEFIRIHREVGEPWPQRARPFLIGQCGQIHAGTSPTRLNNVCHAELMYVHRGCAVCLNKRPLKWSWLQPLWLSLLRLSQCRRQILFTAVTAWLVLVSQSRLSHWICYIISADKSICLKGKSSICV